MKTVGNIILITGGGSGIGRALAREFHTLRRLFEARHPVKALLPSDVPDRPDFTNQNRNNRRMR